MENKFSGEARKVFSTIDRMVAAFQGKDIKGVMACYEQGATVLFEPRQPITGEESVKAMFLQAFGMDPQYDFGEHAVHVTGDIATHVAPWTMKGRLPDGTVIEQRGLSIAVLRKRADGEWLIVQDDPHGQIVLGHSIVPIITL